MNCKKGFTLAEILIVLMVIGVIATMTIPSLMKGVTEGHLKTGYKKAYATIANFATMEKVAGRLPARTSTANVSLLYQGLISALSSEMFISTPVNSGVIFQNFARGTNFNTCLEIVINGTPVDLGTKQGNRRCLIEPNGYRVLNGAVVNNNNATWLVADDNIAYAIIRGQDRNVNCSTAQAITAAANDEQATNMSCAIIIVDVNGLMKGPNTLETQGYAGGTPLAATDSMDTITGDQFKIYLGIDGVSAGPTRTTSTGRIVADLK